MSIDKRTSRPSVRVVILKNNKICLCKDINKEGVFTNYSFPGGGIEDNDNHIVTVKKECLEEVGIVVKDIQFLDIIDDRKGEFYHGERAKLFNGVIDYYYLAYFDKIGKKLFNTEGDGKKFEWLAIEDAIQKIKTGPVSKFNEKRIEVLLKVKQLILSSRKSLINNW